MKRNVSAVGGAEVNAPSGSKSIEREFAEAIQMMIEAMSRSYRNQVFRELSAGTVAKFEDAQVGNYAKVFLTLANRAQKNIYARFTEDKMLALARTFTGKQDRISRKQFYARVSGTIGIDPVELEKTEGLTSQINALQIETFQWIKKIRDDTMQQWTSQTLRQMAEGVSLDDIMGAFSGMVEERKGHAKMVARTQISTYNSLVTKTRAQTLGITTAVWVTSQDERVRASHQARDGKEFELAEGLYNSQDGKTLLPGALFNCRCTYRMIIPKSAE